jgi:hypothetical protein
MSAAVDAEEESGRMKQGRSVAILKVHYGS